MCADFGWLLVEIFVVASTNHNNHFHCYHYIHCYILRHTMPWSMTWLCYVISCHRHCVGVDIEGNYCLIVYNLCKLLNYQTSYLPVCGRVKVMQLIWWLASRLHEAHQTKTKTKTKCDPTIQLLTESLCRIPLFISLSMWSTCHLWLMHGVARLFPYSHFCVSLCK